MHNLAQIMSSSQASLSGARVSSIDGKHLLLEDDSGVFKARRAVACLLAPQEGDLVLATHLGQGESYVIAVLESGGKDAARLEVEQDLHICSSQGQVQLSARDGVEVSTPQKASLVAGELEMTAARGRMTFGALSILAERLSSKAANLSLTVRNLESVLGRVIQSVKSRFTRVDELDRLEAGTISHEAEDLYAARAKYTTVTAEEDVKVDGGMIHLG